MTRQDFIEEVSNFSELIDFCSENGCSELGDVYDEDTYNEIINQDIVQWAREEDWKSLYNILDSLPDGFEYYSCEYGEWTGLGWDDFHYYKENVLEWADRNGVFDEEEEPEPEPEEDDEEYDGSAEDEDISLLDMMCDEAPRHEEESKEEEHEEYDIEWSNIEVPEFEWAEEDFSVEDILEG